MVLVGTLVLVLIGVLVGGTGVLVGVFVLVLVGMGVLVKVFVGRGVLVGVGAQPAMTLIVPVMDGWMLQWYGKLPTLLNVNENCWPVPRLPLSQTAVSLVEVCVAPPVLVQRTVVPTFTVML